VISKFYIDWWSKIMKKFTCFLAAVGICLIFQTANAQTWETEKRLTWTSGDSRRPSVATDSGNNIHVVFYDNTPGNYEIFYKISTDGGVQWTTKRLTWNSGSSAVPCIATDSGNNLHVVWYDESPGNVEIFYSRSTNGGANWTTKKLTFNSGYSASPSIATDSNDNIHVAWVDDVSGNQDIYYKKSTDGGLNWTTKRLTWNYGNSSYPSITSDSSDSIHVTWGDNTPGNYEVFYKRSTNGGLNWTTTRLTWNSGESWFPSIISDSSGNLYLVWHDFTPGNYEVYYKKSTDGGATWYGSKRITWTSGMSWNPEITTDLSGNIHVVLGDDSTGFAKVYYKRTTDGGVSWTTKRLTWKSGESASPKIATDSNNDIHVVWVDGNFGNYEILYNKGKQ
jgi:hypothetical protein